MSDGRPSPPPSAAELCRHAAQLPENEREAFLRQACQSYPALRSEVEALLKTHLQDTFLESLTPRTTTGMFSNSPFEESGSVIGRYKLLEKVGEGGFGAVWMAEQKEPVKRRVALKILKLGMDTKQVVGRFEAERQALALMDHPNISKVLDAGATDAGRPYFVMELVKGVSITKYCDQQRLGPEERLSLFIKVCQAIQHAHQKGIIHRDIKPSNILVTLHDGTPVPKVIDFGIAKATQGDLTDKTVFTQFQQFIGTPAYMSPEQAEMSGLDIDTRADVYSLGVLLYELLTGTTPFDSETLLASGIDEMRRTIREKEPVRPSTRLATLDVEERARVAQQRGMDGVKLAGRLKGDLDWIVMKCLEKDRGRRYDTANGLSADIQRYLADEPVTARPPRAGYRLGKAIRRNRFVFLAGTAAILMLTLSLLAALLALGRERAALHRASQAELEQRELVKKAETARINEARLRELAEASSRRESVALRASGANERRALVNAYSADVRLAQVSILMTNLGRARALLANHLPKAGQEDLRGLEWHLLWQESQGEQSLRLDGHSNEVVCVSFSRDDRLIVSGDRDGQVKIWDSRSGVLHTNWHAHEGKVNSVSFSSDPAIVATSGLDGKVRVVNWREGRILLEREAEESLVTFEPGNTNLAVGSQCGEWNNGRSAKTLLVSVPGNAVLREAAGGRHGFSKNGKYFASVAGQNVVVRKTDDWSELASMDVKPSGNTAISVALTSDGEHLAVAFFDGTLVLWSVPDRQEVFRYKTDDMLWSVDFDASDSKCVVASQSPFLRVFDVDGSPAEIWRGHGGAVRRAVFGFASPILLSGSNDRSVRVWGSGKLQPRYNEIRNVSVEQEGVKPVLLAKSGKLLLTERSKKVLSWDPRSGETSALPLPSFVHPLAYLDATRCYLGRRTDPKSFRTANPIELFAEDGQVLKVIDLGGVRFLERSETRSSDKTVRHARSALSFACVSADESRLAIGTWEGCIFLLNLGTLRIEAAVQTSGRVIETLAFSPDGSLLVSGSWNHEAVIWKVPTLEPLRTLTGHKNRVRNLAFSKKGSRLFSGSFDGSIKVWSTDSWIEEPPFEAHEGAVVAMALSPDDRTLASMGDDHRVRLWNVDTRRELVEFRTGAYWAEYLAFVPEGDVLVMPAESRNCLRALGLPSSRRVVPDPGR